MQIELNYKQRAQLELIAVYLNKTVEAVLVDTAQFLMNCEADYYAPARQLPSQQFLAEDELEVRLANILR